MLLKVNGLVIRESVYGENDKYLSVLSSEYGKISVLCKGVRSYKNKNSNYAQVLYYNEFVLDKKDSGVYVMKEISPIEGFFRARDDICIYALAVYLCDVASEACVEGDQDNKEILSLLLNAIYLLSKSEKKPELVKAVFELRLCALAGFMPDLSSCAVCGKTGGGYMYLDVMNGVIKCSDCFDKSKDSPEEEIYPDGKAIIIAPLSETVLAAMRYIICAEAKKVFSFALPDDELYSLSAVCEKYIVNQFENGFASLEFYKQLKKLDKQANEKLETKADSGTK